MGAQLKSCQLSFSKSLFTGVLKTGVNSRKKCLLLHGAEREGQGMFCRADCACTTSLVAARCWSGVGGLEMDIPVHLCKALRAVFE